MHTSTAIFGTLASLVPTGLLGAAFIAARGQDVSDLSTSQFLAQEIVRAAVGTIGLVAAVPITAGLAALVADLRHTSARADRPVVSDSTDSGLSPASAPGDVVGGVGVPVTGQCPAA